MRHRKAGFKLGRTTAHRTATLRNLAVSLFEHGQITTTIPRAKAVKPMIEKIITIAKTDSPSNRRRVIAKMGHDRHSFDWLYLPRNASDAEKDQVGAQRDRAAAYFNVPESSEVERNRYGELRKAPKLIKHIFENVAPRFADRAGGFTRVVRLGRRRVGDAGEICVLQFVGAEEGPEIGGRLSTRRRTADKRTAYAAKVRKEQAAKAEAPKA